MPECQSISKVVYDPAQLSYEKILEEYWTFAGDPTFPEPDPAYMLRIFATTPAQWSALEKALESKSTELNATVFLGIYNASDYEVSRIIFLPPVRFTRCTCNLANHQFWKARESDQQFDFKQGSTCSTSKQQRRKRH